MIKNTSRQFQLPRSNSCRPRIPRSNLHIVGLVLCFQFGIESEFRILGVYLMLRIDVIQFLEWRVFCHEGNHCPGNSAVKVLYFECVISRDYQPSSFEFEKLGLT